MALDGATINEAAVVRTSVAQARDGRSQDSPSQGADPAAEVARILGISVPIAVTLAERPFNIETLTSLTVGTILEFDNPADAELTLYAANQPIAKGLAVKVGENFGLQITRIGTVRERIDAFHH
jgi:flagellar motor switch protein FliN/FliY